MGMCAWERSKVEGDWRKYATRLSVLMHIVGMEYL